MTEPLRAGAGRRSRRKRASGPGGARARVLGSSPFTPRMNSKQPEISYPCAWTYTLVGEGEDALLAHAELVLTGLQHAKSVTRKSKSGKYTSVEITLVVR